MRWARKEQLLGTDLKSSERLEFLMTDCTTGLKGPSIGDIVSQVVDLELERTLLNLSFIGAHLLSWRWASTLVGPFPWMMTGKVSCSKFLARTLPSSNFSTTSSVNTKTSIFPQIGLDIPPSRCFVCEYVRNRQLCFNMFSEFSSHPFCPLKCNFIYIHISIKDLVNKRIISTHRLRWYRHYIWLEKEAFWNQVIQSVLEARCFDGFMYRNTV